jgi:hypothetical protein
MRKFAFLLTIAMSTSLLAQTHDLPQAVRNSFDNLFPNSVINSWTDNGSYNYQNDWNNNAYYGDFNYDGYPEDYRFAPNIYNPYGYQGNFNNANEYRNDVYSNFTDENSIPYYTNYGYHNGIEYNVPQTYVQPTYNAPTQYQVNFNFSGANMTAIFKPNGTFIIAKGSISRLPAKVENAIMQTFKGQIFRLGTYLEEMITPDYPTSNPVYRVKVKIKHGDNHILKVDSTGKVISNN